MGEEEGNNISVLDAMRGGVRKKEGKTKCGEVMGRLWQGGPCRRLHRDDWIDGEDGV